MAALHRGLLLSACLLLLSVSTSSGTRALHVADRARRLDAALDVKTYTPIIGVLSQPSDRKQSYIAGSYVKYLESAGARVVPILSSASEEDHRWMFDRLNGLLVPGGSQDLQPGNDYYDTMSLFTDLAIEAFQRDDLFPIHYTCLGFEAISIKFSGNYSLLGDFPADETVDKLLWTPKANDSRMLRQVPLDVMKVASDQGLGFMSHSFSVGIDDFYASGLDGEFDLLSTSLDEEGKEYVSTMEHKTLPFFGTQWHPEKAAFEWGTAVRPETHVLSAIRLSQALANEFVQWTRSSTHSFSTKDDVAELNKRLIYNYQATYDPQAYFTLRYTFDASSGGNIMRIMAIVALCAVAVGAVAFHIERRCARSQNFVPLDSDERGLWARQNALDVDARKEVATLPVPLREVETSHGFRNS